ncbi:hypothetical protein I4U23_011610 [Adineta vaga]|nr:hypothetical protein I4U23_011610 [Adineta vaga]
MASFDSSSIVYRSVEKHEQKKALNLWCPIFNNHVDLEERYFLQNASPRYQEGDTLGAWYNDELVSTIHIRRFILQSSEDNKEYLCAGITNVATRMEYRRHGLSRHLLQIVVDKLEKSNEFDISILGTNKPNHYASFGWEQVPQPIRIMIDWKLHTSLNEIIQWRLASDLSHQDIELMFKIHSENPRFYQMKRSPSTVFHHWVKARWKNNAAIVCLYEHEQTQGYVVISKPDREQDICVLE